MEIRRLKPSDDRLEISHIYEMSWKSAYKNIIPQSFLDSIPPGRWADYLDAEGRNTLVITENDRYIGTASYGKSRSPEFPGFGELISIYLLPEYMGRGYGRELLRAAVVELEQMGFCNVFLWVLEENRRARRFYEKEGFILSDVWMEDYIGGKKVRELQYRCHIQEHGKCGRRM